jgi:inner membrane protein involved in colicin E2 resistance
MATIFYLLLVFLSPHIQFNWFWFLISIIFSLVESAGKVIYRYTTDHTLAGHEEEL